MKDIIRNAVYIFKNMFRDRSMTFWELLYPIILVTFFYTAFSGITSGGIEKINIGIEKGKKLGNFSIVNIAPTLANLMGFEMETAEGKRVL